MLHSNPQILSASTMMGDKVENEAGENLGDVKELMLDLESGRVAYVVLSFGGFMGLGDKLFAVPWESLTMNSERGAFQLKVDKERLKDAPGFDKDKWPSHADRTFVDEVYRYYDVQPFYAAH